MASEKRIAVIGTGFRPQGGTRPPAEIAAAVSHRFSAELLEIPDGVFPADPEARAICDTQYHQAGLRAHADGFDAIYVNTVGDYGLAELRGSLDIPVVGSGETSVRMAAALGSFSIVTIWPAALDFLFERVLAASGTADSLIATIHLSDDRDLATLADEHNFVTRMRSCSLDAVAEITTARDHAIRQGASAVVLGCTCMAPAAGAMMQHKAAVTLDPMTLGYWFAEYCLSKQLLPQHVDYGQAKRDFSQTGDRPVAKRQPLSEGLLRP